MADIIATKEADRCLIYFSLTEIATRSSFSRDFLLSMIKSGRLKAFVFDSDWFVAEAWFDDFKVALKSEINTMVSADDSGLVGSDWIKRTDRIVKLQSDFLTALQWSGGLLTLVAMTIFSVWVFSGDQYIRLAFSAAGARLEQSGRLAAAYLSLESARIYHYAALNGRRALGDFWLVFSQHETGRVAGASEEK